MTELPLGAVPSGELLVPQPILSMTEASVGSTPDVPAAMNSVPPPAPGLTLPPVLRSGVGSGAPGLVAAPLLGSWMRKCPCAATVPDSANTWAPLGTTVLVGARYCRVSPVSGTALDVGL